MSLVVIYDSPKDLGLGFAVRTWTIVKAIVEPGKLIARNLPSIGAAREFVPAGLSNIGRTADDDLCIAEVWL